MSNTYGFELPPNVLNGGANANPLNPSAMQTTQNASLTSQQQQNAQNLATMLQKQGQNPNQKFTSPWQVAGQWAQALKGKMMQNQANQGAASLNQASPYGTSASAGAPAGTPAASPTGPTGGTAPGVPGAAPAATPSPLPWSGTQSQAPAMQPNGMAGDTDMTGFS